MDALSFLKQQHREVEAHFKKALKAEQADERRERFRTIDRELRVHTLIEEEIFYPEMRRRAEKTEQRLEVAQAYEEHGLAKAVIEGLERLDAPQEQWQAKLQVLQELVTHHVDEEESTMFKMAHQLFEKEELEELGQRLEKAAASATVPV